MTNNIPIQKFNQFRQNSYSYGQNFNPYSQYGYRPYDPKQLQTPQKHHHYLLLAIVLIATIITTIIVFKYSEKDVINNQIAREADSSPPAFPSENQQGGLNTGPRIEDLSDAPPPLPDFS
ncbi:MAG: hypothetical protein HY361_02050 [Candidatus Aenigmarchaeota archaeon]|nr:hypothetical protein [Candidatus Aenigmarchaeota archaeon]